DASEQVEGEYNAQISIVGTQLQGEPSESLPVSLTVEAAPIAFLSKEELGFENTFVNGETAAQLVTLRNDGLANLNLNEVSIDSDNFTVDPDTGQVIEPGDAQIYEVKFTPQEVGEFNATLSFEGDEVSGEVSLTGEGIPAPELAVDPASFEKQAYVGQQTEYFLDVTNAGEDTLDYTAFSTTGDLIDQDFTGDEFPPEGWFRAGANGGENWTTPGNSACSIWVPDNSACFYWSPSTDGTQRLVTKQLDTGGLSKLNVSFTHLVDHFGGDYELRLETTGDGGETWTTVKSWAPGDLPETDEMIELDNEDVGSDEFHVAWTFDGNSFNLNTWGVLDVQIGTPDWLAVGPNEGSLTAGETLEHTLSVDATDLEEGTLNAEVVANTNDPLAPTASIPFTLNVIEEVAVTPFPTQEEVFPNQDFAVDFNVESLDDLEVFSYEMEMGFNADRMQVQEVVTDGTLSEDLTL
ncbi:MAG: peptidase S8, partial [Bacteroidetes bacterium QH_6_63_17]